MSVSYLHSIIKPTNGAVKLRKKNYRTEDIIELVNEVLRTDRDDTELLARQFDKTEQGLRNLFDFVDQNFIYQEDPELNQWVQTPSYLWRSKIGDCKSYTVFISSVLQNMGVDHYIRYVAFGTRELTHVYPVAILGGREIPLDVVYWKQEGGVFGTEKPFSKKKDFKMQGLYKLGRVANITEAEQSRNADREVARIHAATADIPDVINIGVGDLTEMSQGEWERWIASIQFDTLAENTANPILQQEYRQASYALLSGSMKGIGSLTTPIRRQAAMILNQSVHKKRPAFPPLQVNFVEAKVNGFFKNIGKFFKRIGKAVADGWKKLVNWVFKGIGKKMGPYFTYLFLKKGQVRTPEIRRRIAEQERTFNWLADKGKLDRGKLAQVILLGVAKETGYSAEEIIVGQTGRPELFQSRIGSVFRPQDPNTPPPPGGWQPMPNGAEQSQRKIDLKKIGEFIIKAIKFIWEVIKKITALFKRKDSDQAGNPSEQNSSDVEILTQEQNIPAGSTGGGLLVPLALAGAAFLFLN